MTAVSRRCTFCTVAFAGLATAFLLLPAGAQTRGGTLTIGIDQQVVGFLIQSSRRRRPSKP